MPRFNGLSDEQWNMLEPLLPPPPARKKPGFPANPPRLLLNSILWIKLTGARWCDLPINPNFASRSATNRWMIRWQNDGTLLRIFAGLREIARLSNQLDWQRLAVDGSFSPDQGPRSRRFLRAQRQRLHHTSVGG